MADQGVLVPGADQVEHPEVDADGGVLLPDQRCADEAAAHGFGSPSGYLLPDALARACLPDHPGAVHTQVGVQRPAAVEPGQDVLAAGDRLGDGHAGQPRGRDAGPAQIGGQQSPSREGVVQAVRGAPDRVALRHRLSSSAEHQPARGEPEASPLEGVSERVGRAEHGLSVHLPDP